MGAYEALYECNDIHWCGCGRSYRFNPCPWCETNRLKAKVERLQQNEENIRVDMRSVSERNNANELLAISHRTRNETLEAEVERLRNELDETEQLRAMQEKVAVQSRKVARHLWREASKLFPGSQEGKDLLFMNPWLEEE